MSDPRKNTRAIFPPTGAEITAKSWQTEAAMRMLMNNLHPDVAENPHEPVGVVQTHKDALRVLIANSNLMPHWATWNHFNALDKKA